MQAVEGVSGASVFELFSGRAVEVSRRPASQAMRQGPSIDLYNFVGMADRQVHRRWNDRAKAANAWLDASGLAAVWEARLAKAGVGAKVVPLVRSDVLFAWLGHGHRAIAGCPSGHERLFSWYRQGRLVCGWSGEWPSSGSLVVY